MSRNGSGTYSLPAGNPVVTGTTISSTWANNTLSDIATALTQSLSQDGQTPVTANLPMGGYKLTGLAAGSTAGDSVRYEQFASPPAIGGTTPAAGAFTTLSATSTVSGAGFTAYLASPPAIGGTVAAAGSFTTLSASSTVSGTGFSTYLASPPAIGGTAAASGKFTTLAASGQFTSTVATGTAPFVVTSTTPVSNLSITGTAGAAANKGYLSGCTMSTAGSSATISIGAGVASDSTAAYLMTLSAISKTTSAWSVGTAAGGLDTGSIAANTWYYFYVIRRTDTGVVDVVFSTSSTSPTLPASYTQYRYIGAAITDGSSNWYKFIQLGREFYLDTPPIEVSTAGSGTTAVTATLTYIPKGRKMLAIIQGGAQAQLYASPLDLTDQAPSATASPLSTNIGTSTQFRVITNTSGQFRYRCSVNGTLYLVTLGWVDYADMHG